MKISTKLNLLKEIFQKITVVIGIGTFSSLKIGYNLRLWIKRLCGRSQITVQRVQK